MGGTINPALTGNVRALDFNPTVDRIRLLGSGGAVTNLRFHPDTGAVSEDADLSFMMGDVNAADTPAVVNGAYTNSRPGATTTTLYDIESGNDILATQVPANNGTLQTVGDLGFDIVSSGGFTGFDISGTSGTAYLVGNKLGTGGLVSNSLYQVNLATGAASLLGAVSGVNGNFRDIAVANVPEPSTLLLATAALATLVCARRLSRAKKPLAP